MDVMREAERKFILFHNNKRVFYVLSLQLTTYARLEKRKPQKKRGGTQNIQMVGKNRRRNERPIL